MKDKINFYFAMLLITIAGSGAALLIVNIATTDVVNESMRGSSAEYASLQQSILQSNQGTRAAR